MAKKERKKEKLFEEVQFKDIERAKREVTFAKINQIRILIGFIFSLIAIVFTALMIWGNPEQQTTFMGIAVVLAIPSYIIGGGIFKALKVAWKITKIGWFLVPAFPADILIALACFFFAVFGLLFVPVIFVGLNYVQHKKTLDAATSYLAQCGEVVETATAE
ncbi:MAG: hypothetical protein E7542_03040 [Ruminococcaceae bacterium]|nr:hypothetical protein [Oscillospiraceae bacterium]